MAINNKPQVLDINHPVVLFAAIYINVIGAAVFIVQPGFIQLLVSSFGYGAEQAGYIASAEMWGIALATVLLNFLIRSVSWRLLLAIACVLIILGNMASIIAVSAIDFSLWRFVAGVGSGVMISIGFSIVGLTQNPDRNFGLVIAAVLTYGAVGLFVMPAANELIGIKGIIVFFALLGASVLPLLRYLPVSGDVHLQADDIIVAVPERHKYFGIAAVFFYFLGQGVIWAYLFLIGTDGGSSEQSIANSLSLSQLVGIAGAFLAATTGLRYGRIKPIVLGIAGGVVPLLLLFQGADILLYTVAVCIYNFSWSYLHPYLLAAMASFEAGGRIVTYAVSGQMTGLASGPALAAFVLKDSNFTPIIALGILNFTIALGFILPAILRQRKSSQLPV